MTDEDELKNVQKRRDILKLAAAGAVAPGGLAATAKVATAQEGEKLGEVSFPSTGRAGVSNTFTGEFLVVVDGYTTNEIDIYEPSPETNATATHVATKILPVEISGVTWDHTRGRLWATQGTDGTFYLVNIGNQTESEEISQEHVESKFTLSQRGWPADGMAYDGDEDALWWSYDGSDRVWLVNTDGTIEDDIIPERNEGGEEFIHHSGVAVGNELNDRPTLYLGENAEEAGAAENSIVRVYADTGEQIITYADVPFRVEDITCDPVTYAPQEALVVKDASNNKSTTFRVEDGTCPVASGGVDYTVLEEALDRFEAAYKSFLESHFRGQGAHEAALYHEYGEEYAERIINYWGYKAGILSEDDVREGARELGDATLEMTREEVGFEYGNTNAEILYEFYKELFSVLATETTLTAKKNTAEEHYIGNYPGQDAALTFDDEKTIADGFAEDWNLRTEVIEELTADEELTQDQVQRIATGLTEKSKRLRARGEDIIDSMVTAAEEVDHLFDETKNEVQVRTLENNLAAERSDVGSDIAVSGAILIGTAVAGLASFGAGYAATKCGGALTAAKAQGVEFEWIDLSVTREDNAVLSSVMTGVSLGQIVNELGSPLDSESQPQVEPGSAIGSWLTANFMAGAKAGSVDLALTGGEVFSESQFARFADVQIRNLNLPDIEDETQLDSVDSFVGSIKQFLDDLPFTDDWFSFGPPTNGEATGTIEIENTGSVPFRPVFELDYSLRNDRGKFRSGFKAVIEDGPEIINPGNTETYEITYQVPVNEGFLSGELDVSLGMSPEAAIPTPDAVIPVSICELDYYAIKADNAKDRFNIVDEVTIETFDQGVVTESNVQTTTFTPDAGLKQATVELDYEGYASDLLVYDESGNRVGYDSAKRTEVNEISEAAYSGRDTGERGNEWITLSPTGETYTAEISAPPLVDGTDMQSQSSVYEENRERRPENQSDASLHPADALTSKFEVNKIERPELPPKLSMTPSVASSEVSITADSASFSVVLEETNGDQTAESVSLTASPLIHEGSDKAISDDLIKFSTNNLTLDGSAQVRITVEFPDNLIAGSYSGTLNISSANADTIIRKFELLIGESPVDDVTREQYDAVLPNGTDTTLGELRISVNDWADNRHVDTIRITLGELRRIINYWAANR